MYLKKTTFNFSFLVIAAILFVSCSKKSSGGETDPPEDPLQEGIFFTNTTTGEEVKATFAPGITFDLSRDMTHAFASVRDASGNQRSSISIDFPGNDLTSHNWNSITTFGYSVRQPDGSNKLWSERYKDGNNQPYSAGSVVVTAYGDQFTGYVTGTFTLAAMGDNTGAKHAVSGRFRLKRTGDN